ncbi:MAG TPA: YidC/Oxa1 family membrane protein insertase [Vicinamibacteria bacterium]|nr:YidC/Oxa1 family membrane protein insertase [Vicinamibacteria bacterium]
MPIANVLQPLIDVFDAILVFFHDNVGLSWGTSIIALTVVVRLAILPLAIRQFHSMQGLQKLAPEMKKLQEKYKDDRQRLNQEMMKLYQEHKVNPFGSCLPLILQMPVFISLFYMLRSDLRVDICGQEALPCGDVIPGSAKWFFIPDITARATGAVLVTLLVLYIGSQLLSSVLMSVTADHNQRMLIIALPFLFVPFIISFPAGLLLYWITTNIWTVGQQTVIRKRAGMPVGIRSQPSPTAMSTVAQEKEKPARGRAGAKAGDGDGDGEGRRTGKDAEPEPATARPRRQVAPPPPPRRKKKQRSGRRR